MSSPITNEYNPDYVSHPGETLEEMRVCRGMSCAELAQKMGRDADAIASIVAGNAPITPDIAEQLEVVFSVPARFWNNRQRQYEEVMGDRHE